MSEVRQVGIVGGGFMGSGIAESVARAGIAVAVYEPDEAPLERSRERISTSVDRAVSGGKLEAGDAEALKGRDRLDARPRASWRAPTSSSRRSSRTSRSSARCSSDSDAVLGPDALLTSNTSSIPIAELAASTGRPQQRARARTSSRPSRSMKLVEIVRRARTRAEEAVARAEAFAESHRQDADPRAGTAPASSSTRCSSRT